ncbi:AF4/FMR2 family member lilli [Polyergus mexicanus]|uniref:AF4/FMR2 family member lilli n=1 Tax=Polyergus mexicanus TaxID=615972 RepID=UPI0038B60B05
MADDGPSTAEDATAAAASELGDSDSRVTRERHKRADATTPIVTTSGQDASSFESSIDDRHRSHHDRRVHRRHHQHHSPSHSYHHPPPPSHHYHHHHHHFNPYRHHLTNHRDNDSDRIVSNNHRSGGSNSGGGGGGGDDSTSCVDATGTAASDDEEKSSSGASGGVGVGGGGSGSGSGSVCLYHRDDVRIEIVRSVASEDDDEEEDDDDDYYDGSGGVDSDCDGDSGGSSNNISASKSGAGGVAVIMTGGNNNNAAMRVGVGVEDADGTADSSSSSSSSPPPRCTSADGAPEVNEDRDDGRRRTSVAVVATTTTTRETRETKPMAKEETRADGEDAAAATKTDNVDAVARHQDSPFKGQVRMAEDTLVGPCGKKRCADRYDSSESSDSGVAVSCGECSSSGTSDITEPGSPCSTSSDEGVAALRGTSASPLLPTQPKLAPSSQIGTRPQWPWTPPLAATACSTTAYKRLRGEPEAGALPRSGAADPTSRGAVKTNGKTGQHHHESQGKITEYFKTQIKPQQPKVKKASEMSVLVAKSSSEFRRPPTVQRNKGGLAKYLGNAMSSNPSRGTSTNDWEARTLTSPSAAAKKPPLVVVPRANSKIDKKLPKPLPTLPISNDVLKNLSKISSLRLTSDVNINTAKCSSPPATAASSLLGEPVPLDFKGCILSKPHVNENNNLTNSCGGILGALRSQGGRDSPISRLSPSKEDSKDKDAQPTPVDEDDVDEEDSRSSESKPSLSPILSAPTTIRFPARAPEKDRPQTTDSGICRWDKCEASFESVGGLLEHLQAAHINTQTGGDNFVCHWQGCKVQGRTSCSRRWLERHVLSHGGNKPFRCIVDGCGCRFSSQTALERHVNGHFNQSETSSNNGRRSCENGGKLVRRNGKKLRYRRQPWSARLFDYFDSGVMEGLQHRLQELAASRTQGRLAETPGNSMALTSQVLARRVESDGKTKVLLRWYPQDIEPDEWVLESEVQSTKHIHIRKMAASNAEEVSLALYPAISSRAPPTTRVKQRRKPVKNS